jgi:hypothetical protein
MIEERRLREEPPFFVPGFQPVSGSRFEAEERAPDGAPFADFCE